MNRLRNLKFRENFCIFNVHTSCHYQWISHSACGLDQSWGNLSEMVLWHFQAKVTHVLPRSRNGLRFSHTTGCVSLAATWKKCLHSTYWSRLPQPCLVVTNSMHAHPAFIIQFYPDVVLGCGVFLAYNDLQTERNQNTLTITCKVR